MARGIHTLDEWAADFHRTARQLLAGQGVGAEQDGYRVCASPCERHGAGCVVVVYGMFREHLRWNVEGPRPVAERVVATMLPRPTVPAG